MKPNIKARNIGRIDTSFDTWGCDTVGQYLSRLTIAIIIGIGCLITWLPYPVRDLTPTRYAEATCRQALILQIPLCDPTHWSTARAQARLLGGAAKSKPVTGDETDQDWGGKLAALAQRPVCLSASALTVQMALSRRVNTDELCGLHTPVRGPPLS